MADARIESLQNTRKFLLGGEAVFTLVSKRTGDRKTFQVVSNDQGAWFVGLFTNQYGQGPDNKQSYKYLAFLYPRAGPSGDFTGDKQVFLNLKANKERWGEDAFRVFEWLIHRLNLVRNVEGEMNWVREDDVFNAQAEFWHSGKCSRCSRTLTDPESIARGLGPVCAEAANG